MGSIRVLSTEPRIFADRVEAGRLLAEYLPDLHDPHAVLVLGIPRGGIVIAEQIAQFTGALLDVVLTRKLGAPHNPELAIGAVAESGDVYLNEDVVASAGAAADYIEQARQDQLAVIEDRRNRYRRVLPKVPLKGRTVILTDDGIATGATMQAAIHAARAEQPARIIAAVPVAAPDSVERLSGDADQTVCLSTPYAFYAIGQFYNNFEQVTDAQVLDILTAAAERYSHAGR